MPPTNTADEILGEEPGEIPDPEQGELDAAEEETPEQVEARVRAELDTRYQAEFEEHKKRYNRRFNRGQEALSQYGLKLDENGEPVFVDPQKASLWQALSTPGAQQQRPEEPEPAPMPDPTYDPDGYQKWFREEVRREARGLAAQLVAETVEPLKAELERTRGFMAQHALPTLSQRAKGALEAYGVGDVADHPMFAQLLSQAVSSASPQQLADDTAFASTALMLVPIVRRQMADDGWQPPERAVRQPVGSEAGARAAVNRAGLTQIGASRGTSGRAEVEMSAEERELLEINRAAGIEMSLDELRAASDETGESYRRYQAEQARRRR